MGGHDPYSSNSKGCAELVTSRVPALVLPAPDGTPAIASARAGNVIGGGDWARGPPDPRRHASALDRPCRSVIRNPDAIRPWQHVLNPLSGYLVLARAALGRSTTHAEGWNFGPADGDARPVGWIVERLDALWRGRPAWEPRRRRAAARGAASSRSIPRKARARLGWAPTWDLDAGARERSSTWYTDAARRSGPAPLTPGADRAFRGRRSAPWPLHEQRRLPLLRDAAGRTSSRTSGCRRLRTRT